MISENITSGEVAEAIKESLKNLDRITQVSLVLASKHDINGNVIEWYLYAGQNNGERKSNFKITISENVL
jgi:hypothetical protein